MKISIDGPAGAGKSTVALMVAQKLDFDYLDTGAMYRAIALAVMRSSVASDDAVAIAKLVKESDLEVKTQTDGSNKIYLNGDDVSSAIRQQAVSDIVSDIANHKAVRDVLVEKQRQMAKNGNVVLDGRDIGTVVLPDAELKIFLTASLAVRAKRRYADLQKAGEKILLAELEKAIEERDKKDEKNTYGPMRPAEDAITIDTDNMTINQIVERIAVLAKK